MDKNLDQKAIQALSREFIRQKVKKYQYQFPRMSEWNIYQKIAREWKMLSDNEKLIMYHLYISNGFISSSTSTIKQQESGIPKTSQEKQKQTKQKQVAIEKDIEKKSKQKQKQDSSLQKTVSLRKEKTKHKNHKNQVKAEQNNLRSQEITSIQEEKTPQIQIGKNLKSKLKKLDRSNQQSVNFYRQVFQNVKKQHKQIVSQIVKQYPALKAKEQATALEKQKVSLTVQHLERIVEKIQEEEAQSQLSPQQSFRSKRGEITQLEEIITPKQDQKMKLTVKLKPSNVLPQTIKEQTKNQFLAIKLEQKVVVPKKTNDYLQFYKYGYKKLKQDCDYLTGNEITQILRTIWQKHKAKRKLAAKNSQSPLRPHQNPSTIKQIELSGVLARKVGKINFIKQKIKNGFTKEQAENLWTCLPIQSKKKWIYPSNKYSESLKPNSLSQFRGIVRYKSGELTDSRCYELNWDIFDQRQNQSEIGQKFLSEQKQEKS